MRVSASTFGGDSEALGLEATREYILRNIVPARTGRKCVDGRYLPTQASGMIARPGGDCGYVMALMAVNERKSLGLTPEQCFNAVYKAVSRNNGHFCMHTDQHADPDPRTHKGLIGCGHIAKAAMDNLSKEYDLDGEDVERFVAYARNIADITSGLEIINLQGEHQEVGVLTIHSDSYTVNSEDPDLRKMYFIYDERRDTKFLKNLVEEMGISNVSFEEIKRESDLQLKATLRNLAKGKPIYSVIFRDKTPDVKLVGAVE